MVDIHTHIIPGVDDGAKSMDDSVAMCRMAAEDGVSTIVATPHAYWNRDINSGPVIHNGVVSLREALQAHDVSIEVIEGCEVPMDRRLPDRIDMDLSWTYGGAGAYLLLEPPWGPLPDYCFQLIEQLLERGITPVIAHPERSPDLQERPQLVSRMVEQGAVTQVTANSLLGKHGPKAKDVGWLLVKRDLAHAIASDSHNSTNRSPRLSEARQEIEAACGVETARRLFEENPQSIASNMPILVARPKESIDLGPGPRRRGGLLGLFRR